jgi:hypothetical protein
MATAPDFISIYERNPPTAASATTGPPDQQEEEARYPAITTNTATAPNAIIRANPERKP